MMNGGIGIADLAEAVAGFIEEVSGGLDGRQAFHARVACNALAIIAREARQDPLPDETAFYARETGEIAAEACRAYCAAIRRGEVVAVDPGMLAQMSDFVAARLAVDNPKFSTLARLRALPR
ncbi:DUF6285 domain-containing protein [Pacificimonas flava]|uniref:DUF6285 domain-containing protein n=1 Tax=Pacificimonas flava TaxID=1234595 RepID=M2SGU8_9SPHN|nr:DUF6285 domain-containing protein [Pacificimonas flava]EMD84600.1 hypothetical protein C725_0530 [Pacificimonas flava]MBB5279531.1 putative aminopeptidase FrvX [Pacificimonas flava]